MEEKEDKEEENYIPSTSHITHIPSSQHQATSIVILRPSLTLTSQ